ncbi:MAG: universal stress protein [Dehalococcoidia bacterium]|jgi:nucleotide-binding universal stress UspA family protein|nr:universal stress protein [Dehalococcoidia bacterium]
MRALIALTGHDIDNDIAAAAARVLDPARDQIVAMHVVHPRELEVTADRGRSLGISGRAADGLTVSRELAEPVLAENTVQATERLEGEFHDHVQILKHEYLTEFTVEEDVRVNSDPAEAIGAAVKELGIGGVAMGTRSKRARFARALLGSAAEGVVRQVNVPVLIVKEGTVAGVEVD